LLEELLLEELLLEEVLLVKSLLTLPWIRFAKIASGLLPVQASSLDLPLPSTVDTVPTFPTQ